MIIKLKRVISCSSEDPSYPVSNLLEYRSTSNSPWRCAKPGETLATVIFEFEEPSCITGVEIGNYRSCIVVVSASTSAEPDNWTPIVNYQFLTHDEAVNGKFKDQVQIFTKRELNPEYLNIKFDRVKVTCMQSANPREVFGLLFIVFRTEVVIDMGLDIFGKFKFKKAINEEKFVDGLKGRKCLRLFHSDKKNDQRNEIKEKLNGNNHANYFLTQQKQQEVMKKENKYVTHNESKKNSAIQSPGPSKAEVRLLNEETKANASDKPVTRTPFGDVIPSTLKKVENEEKDDISSKNGKKRTLSSENQKNSTVVISKKKKCSNCQSLSKNELCIDCNNKSPCRQSTNTSERNKEVVRGESGKRQLRKKKSFEELLKGVTFSLSGYVNPQRDEIRRKALKMGAKYIADPNTSDKLCTHLICAFRNTPKYQQLKGHSKIVSHKFIEDCYDKKRRIPWRRYSLDKKDREEPDSEEDLTGIGKFIPSENEENIDSEDDFKPYDAETDEDSDFDY